MILKALTSKSIYTFLVCLAILNGIAQRSVCAKSASARPVAFNLNVTKKPNDLLVKKKQNSVLSLHGYIPGSRTKLYSNVEREIEIESLDSFVMIRERVAEAEIRPPVALTLPQYQEMLQEEKMRSYWSDHFASHLTDRQQNDRGAGGINLDIPVRIKSKAFQKIFGGNKVGLTVNGNIRIQAGLRNENRSEVRTALAQGANTTFKMQQTQRFSVTGKIGDKVTVNVDQDSERAFDFENNVRINYQGYEDEIIQKVEAGNISLSLPGTRYVTFSGKNAGLFGIKSQMKLGDLDVTTIASQEKGESQRITLSGGAEEGAKKNKIYPYVRYTYFFLDTLYRENYKHFDSQGIHIAVPEQDRIENIEVYKAANGYETEFPDENIRAWATFNASPEDTVGEPEQGFSDEGFFIRLEKDEYYLEPNLGFIRMNNRVSDNEILAVTYTTAGGDTVGREFENVGIFKLIKPQNPLPTDATWDLEWKHVYSLGGRNIDPEGFDVKIYSRTSGEPDQEVNSATGEKWVTIFGLDTKDQDGNTQNPDGLIDTDGTAVDFINGELHFPDLQPFAPEGYFQAGALKKPDLGNRSAEAIYNSVVDAEINLVDENFIIEVTTKNRSTEFNLGFNVIEGSEVVSLDGQELQQGRDYTIDYFTGTLTILDERASNPSSKLDISYERNQLFQLEKKTILGMRAEYKLGRDSFLGSTLLYLNESTLDRKVRVGRGPIQNLVWDVNTRLNFNPNFLGKAFDFLPLLRAKGESTLNFEGEIAQVLPTPNTLNSPKTGDNRGVAYIDDFEGAKKSVNLGVLRRNWTRASQPADSRHTPANMMSYIWFNPFQQVHVNDIYPNREVNPNVPNRVHVLTFRLFPDPNLHNPDNPAQPDLNSWAGVQRALSPGLFDQSQTKFIEVMVNGFEGRVHIDLGGISEDVISNGILDTEDQRVGGIRNDILDAGEDLGLDGIDLPDPPTFNFPKDNFINKHKDQIPYDFWDTNGNDTLDVGERWSYDDWFYTESEPLTYFREDLTGAGSSSSIIGTQSNANDASGRRPDTEDINANGVLDRVNSYFSFSFSLDSTHTDTSLVVGGNPERGWRLFRIPFVTDNPEFWAGSGRPSETQIEFARIWIDSLETSNESEFISVAEVSLVGSDWKEIGSTNDEFKSLIGLQDTTVAVTQINTHEDPFYATTLLDIGVEGEEDKVTGVRAREQSLVLKATDLAPEQSGTGRNAGIAQKSLFQSENYIHYERIRMFVYGRPETANDLHIPSDTSSTESQLEYFFRFGLDVNNYYEYRSRIYEGWNEENHMDVNLQELTTLDRRDTSSAQYNPATDTYVKYLTPDSSKAIRVKGNPSLTNVKMLILGIKNLHSTQPFNGEVWFNELRLSDVEQDRGMAMRARTNMRIGNFATVNGEIERRDADFHNVAQRFGSGNNSFNTNLNANVNLENFLPESWGLSMPLSVNFRNSSTTPKYFPGRDREVDGNVPDSIRTVRSQNGFNIAFRRQAKSDNFFLKHTLDNLSFKLGRSESHLASPTKRFSDVSSWTGNLDYRLEFGRNNSFSPFSWLPDLPLIDKVKRTKLYYTPQNISFRVSGSKTLRTSLDRNQNEDQQIRREDYVIDRSVRTSMKIFESLSVDYSRTHKADMRGSQLRQIFTGELRDINVNQSFTARYTPQLFSWLNNSFNYSSNYTFNDNLQQRNTGKSIRTNNTLSADFNFRWKQLVKSLFGDDNSGRRPPRRGRPGSRGHPDGPENQFNLFQEKEDDGPSFNPLRLLGSFFSNFKDISFNYSQRADNSQLGVLGFPSVKYQFGLTDDSGVGSDSTLSTFPRNFRESNTLRVNSGIAFGRAVDVGLTFQHSDQENLSTQISGSTSDSWLKYGGLDMPFPEWNVRVAGLEELPLFSKLFQSVSFSHAFSGQRDIVWNDSTSNETQRTFTTNFRPLGKLDLNFKNGFTGNIQMNRSITEVRTTIGGNQGARMTTRQDVSVTANYSKQSGFRLPIWPFNNKELKNSIDFTFTFNASSVVTDIGTRDGEEVEFTESERTDRWSFQPRVTYSFSNRVRGGAFIEIGKTSSKRVGNTSVKEFGLDINVSIRGK
ncbi:cell surface protein SprA [candidate division KSB1 bacterium]|nr:cell surface protein SprA [candidate division KSB1 bacterium]NIT70698.1 cell surface protein SprA [candidate division KSB1 bacterium]NIU24429.1 cell surface protein SprA [candidate division KSB1 bacterium]NIU94300.1 cell surface protein SprA [candidate division KSB1 bacterium]NIV96968.1 cell surface protein SprA [candidate division KSB1 bacterium]